MRHSPRETIGQHLAESRDAPLASDTLGCLPAASASGTPSAAAVTGFVVRAQNVRNKKVGLMFYGVSGRASTPFSRGSMCVATLIKRTTGLTPGGSPTGNDWTGVFLIDMCAFAARLLGGTPLPGPRNVDTIVACQFWRRDPGFPAPNGTTLSNEIEYVVQP